MALKFYFLCLLFPLRLLSASYFVDYDTGSDSNAGTSTGAAFKHCPGDALATSTAAGTTLAAGDTVIFKGGIVYRGSVSINWSGTLNSRIIYDGNQSGAWGTGRAIMDGSVLISTSWTRCADAADCGGNANFANIYYTTVPSGVTNGWPQLLMDGTTQTFTAQEPNPTNRYIFDLVSTWIPISTNSSTTNSISSATYFSQASSSYWDGAWVGVWAQANSMKYRAITNFIPASDTIQFATVNIYTDRDGLFSIFNHVSLIDVAGEHAVDVANNRLYVWPTDSLHPSNHVWSVGSVGNMFIGSTKHDVTIQGFSMRGAFHDVDAVGYGGCGVQFSGANSTNLSVLNCDMRHMRSMDRDWLMTVPNASGRTIMSNTIAKSYGGGIYTGGAGIVVFSNHMSEITGTAIYAPSTTNGVISSNYLSAVVGTHANGITLYTHAESTVVSHNYVRNVYAPFTYQDSHNLTFAFNMVDADGAEQRINSWGGNTGTFKWLNNTFVNCLTHTLMTTGTDGTNVTHIIKNNIIDGGGSFADMLGSHDHNIYTGLYWYQNISYGWSLGPNESTNTPAALFVNPTGGDWRLKAGSPAYESGTNISVYGFSVDIAGQPITTASIGAYGGTNGVESASSRSPTLFQGNIRAQGSVIFR